MSDKVIYIDDDDDERFHTPEDSESVFGTFDCQIKGDIEEPLSFPGLEELMRRRKILTKNDIYFNSLKDKNPKIFNLYC